MGVGFRHPVISRQVALIAGSIFFACVDLSHTGHTYSAADRQRARAVERIVPGFMPHFVPLSLRMILFLAQTLAFVFSMCFLYVKLRSRVTPR